MDTANLALFETTSIYKSGRKTKAAKKFQKPIKYELGAKGVVNVD